MSVDPNKQSPSFPFTTTEKGEDNSINIDPNTKLSTKARAEIKPIPPKQEIHYYNQLTKIQKMKVQTAFEQALIRGYTLPDVPLFIHVKTGLMLDQHIVEQLVKNQRAENKAWFYNMAKDQIAYVSAYRKSINSIEEYQREIWLLTIHPKTDNITKLACYRELHSLTKTLVLLLRDLPFITQLSKYYDINKISQEYNNPNEQQQKNSREKAEFNPIRKLANINRASKQDSGLYLENDRFNDNHGPVLESSDQFDKLNISMAHKILDQVKSNKIYHNKSDSVNRIEPEKLTDEVMNDMRRQMKDLEYLQPSTAQDKQDNNESARKLQEQIAIDNHLSKIEDEIDNLGGLDNIPNNEKLQNILDKYEGSLSFLESFMSDEQRDSIKRIRELKEDK